MGSRMLELEVNKGEHVEVKKLMESNSIDTSNACPVTKEKKGSRKYAGLLFALLASLSVSFSGICTKMLSEGNYHSFNIVIWRNQGLTLVVPLFALYARIVKKQRIFNPLFEDKGKTLLLLLLRGTCGFCALSLFIFSLKYLKLADATVISMSTPIVVALFARISLGEPCGIVPVVMALVTFSGVIVLLRPPVLTGQEAFDGDIIIGTALALGCMLFVSTVFVLIRYFRKLHFTLPLMAFGYVSTVESLIFAAILGVLQLPRNEDWLIVIIGLLISLVGQIFQTLSLKYEAAGPVALIRTLDIVFSFINQLIFLKVYPDLISIIGALIITFGIVVITCRKWLSTLPEKHSARARFWFLLK